MPHARNPLTQQNKRKGRKQNIKHAILNFKFILATFTACFLPSLNIPGFLLIRPQTQQRKHIESQTPRTKIVNTKGLTYCDVEANRPHLPPKTTRQRWTPTGACASTARSTPPLLPTPRPRRLLLPRPHPHALCSPILALSMTANVLALHDRFGFQLGKEDAPYTSGAAGGGVGGWEDRAYTGSEQGRYQTSGTRGEKNKRVHDGMLVMGIALCVQYRTTRLS